MPIKKTLSHSFFFFQDADCDFIDLYLKRVGQQQQQQHDKDKDDGWEGEEGMKRLMGALDTIPLGSDGLFMGFNTVIFCLAK